MNKFAFNRREELLELMNPINSFEVEFLVEEVVNKFIGRVGDSDQTRREILGAIENVKMKVFQGQVQYQESGYAKDLD